MTEFHRAHNKDPDNVTGPWAPASFEEAPDLTLQRTIKFALQLNMPGWLKTLTGAGKPSGRCPPLALSVQVRCTQQHMAVLPRPCAF